MGFSTKHNLHPGGGAKRSQSLSGWGGVFNFVPNKDPGSLVGCRNPFQGGVGFSTRCHFLAKGKGICSRNPFQGGVGFSTYEISYDVASDIKSQSLSGWGGVFNLA